MRQEDSLTSEENLQNRREDLEQIADFIAEDRRYDRNNEMIIINIYCIFNSVTQQTRRCRGKKERLKSS